MSRLFLGLEDKLGAIYFLRGSPPVKSEKKKCFSWEKKAEVTEIISHLMLKCLALEDTEMWIVMESLC